MNRKPIHRISIYVLSLRGGVIEPCAESENPVCVPICAGVLGLSVFMSHYGFTDFV